MLNFNNVALRRGVRELFVGASFTLHQRQKVGLTGANGAGKSSLFALLRGELQPDSGDFSMPPNLEIAHVAQETPVVNCSALDYVMDGDRQLREVQRQLAIAEQRDDGMRQAECHAVLEHIGGYTAHVRAARLLSGLGFGRGQEQNPVEAFSGGWRMRLNLAQALMCRSDLLLLDEPTNHLDLDAVIWLQDWLSKYPGTLLLISHDRDFLDQITDHILHIEHARIELYTGNYSTFERMRAEQLAQQQAAFEKQQREIAHIRGFIDRFKAKATKAKQAQSRIKTLARLELIAQAHIQSPFQFSFSKPETMPNPLLQLTGANIGYGSTRILEPIDLTLAPGDRIGLLGPNGAGKSSLIKVLAGEMQPLSGQMQVADALKIGYFAQHQLEQLNGEESPLRHLQRIDRHATEKDLRHYLGGFDFRGDKALEPVAPFSGGEKVRLVLALLVYRNPNLLLLDEPTNHLDLEMRHALSVALQDYEGALVVVSHDRHLLRAVTDRLWLVADGRIRAFDGDLDDYRLWLAEHNKNDDEAEAKTTGTVSRKEQRKKDAERRQKMKPLTDALARAERKLEQLQALRQQLEEQLADRNIYQDSAKDRLQQLLAEKSRVDGELEQAETDWLEAGEKLEEAQ